MWQIDWDGGGGSNNEFVDVEIQVAGRKNARMELHQALSHTNGGRKKKKKKLKALNRKKCLKSKQTIIVGCVNMYKMAKEK